MEDPADKLSEVEEAFTSMESYLKELGGVLEELDQRLLPVMRPPEPCDADSEKGVETPVRISERIKRANEQLVLLCRHGAEIISRLEI